MAGGVTKAGNIKAQILIPSPNPPEVQPASTKPHQPKPAKSGLTKQNYVSSVTCKSCSKLLQVRCPMYPLLTLPCTHLVYTPLPLHPDYHPRNRKCSSARCP